MRQNFFQYFGLLPTISLSAPHSSSSIIRGRYSRPNSDRRIEWTVHPIPHQETRKVSNLCYSGRFTGCLANAGIQPWQHPCSKCVCLCVCVRARKVPTCAAVCRTIRMQYHHSGNFLTAPRTWAWTGYGSHAVPRIHLWPQRVLTDAGRSSGWESFQNGVTVPIYNSASQ
jgi:hypothetical protein